MFPRIHSFKFDKLNLYNCFFSRSAKVLVRGEPNVSYICSRYYRAPELIFGATDYTCQIGESFRVLHGLLLSTVAG